MPFSLIFILCILLFLAMSWYSMRMALFGLILLVPIYILRLDLGPIPTNLWELLVAWVFLVQVIRKPLELIAAFQRFIRPIFWPLLLIFAGLAIGLLVTPDLFLTAGIIKGWFVAPILFYILLCLNLKKEDLVPATVALLFSTLPIALAALDQVVTRQFMTNDGRASAWFASANYLTLYLVPICLVSIHLWSELSRKRRWILVFVWAANLLAIYFSFSFGGWLALIASLAIGIIWYRFDLFKKWLLPTILAGALAVTLLYFTNERFATMLNLAEKSSASIRLQVWAAALLMIKENFFIGLGAGSFTLNYQQYVLRLFNPPIEYAILHPHNLAFQILISSGLAGLLGFVWLFILYFKKIVLKNPLTLGLFMAMVAILVHGLVDTPYFKNDLAALFWILFAFNTIQSHGQQKT